MNNKLNNETDFIDGGFNVNYILSARNSGYNNYTAIADIIDNSLDNEVNSTKVNITVETEKSLISSIKISDNGCGMTKSILNEAFKWGANTGKSRELDLGSYGIGLKAASISIGKKIEVFTKAANDKFYIVTCDVDEIINNGNFRHPSRIGTEEEYEKFKLDVDGKTGTIVLLTKLDRISNNNLTQFTDKLKKDLGLFYKIFIDELNVIIKVNNQIVKSIDPMYRNEIYSKRLSELNEKFSYQNKEFSFNAYYLENIDLKLNQTLDFPRNYKHRGLYIYRNNRLVGRGLDLGIINKFGDGYYNGLRIELFIDGGSDELFTSTTMKMILERDKDEINQGFRDSCNKAISQYIRMCKIEEDHRKSKDGVNKDTEKEFETLVNEIQKNKLIKKKIEKNEKIDKDDIEIITPEPSGRKNTFAPRTRNNSFSDWKFVSLGDGGNLFNVSKENGKFIVHMNIDHVFWIEFLSKATNETKGVLIRLFTSMAMSLDSIGYYDETEKEILLREYLLEMSINLRKLIIG